jgi:hypothetical protein
VRRLPGAVALLVVGSCKPIEPMPEDLPCREAGYAIAARTAECTGKAALGQRRYEAYRKQYACIEWSADAEEFQDTSGREAADLWSCAFTIRNAPCEVVDELGDDISAWLALDPGCTWVAEPKGGDQ